MSIQLDVFALTAHDIAEDARRTGLIPTTDESAHLSAAEMTLVAHAWMAGIHSRAEVSRKVEAARFAARGWPFAWLIDSDHPKAGALESAVDVVDRYFTPELIAGAQHADAMGVAHHKGFGGSEGIQVKQPAYCSSYWLISVYCTTGPVNFSVGEGVEFEPGSKSHVFHLLYRKMPDRETLAGDIAAHPLITSKNNRPENALRWQSEGWRGPSHTAPWEHRNWQQAKSAEACAT